MRKAIKNWLERRATNKQLNMLTDRELNDIGITRGDISNIVRGM